MGYRVDYQPIRKVRGAEKRKSRVAALTGVFLLLFFFLINSMWPQGAELLRSAIFPGDAAVTAAALEDFALELKSGEEFSGALESFCHKIIEGASFDQN